MFRWCFMMFLALVLLLLVCCTFELSSATRIPCPSGAGITCKYVAPPTYDFTTSNTSNPLGASDRPFASLSAAILAADVSQSATTYLILYSGTYNGPDNNNLNTFGRNLVFVSYDYFSNSMSLLNAASDTIIDGGLYYGYGTNCLTVSQGSSSAIPTVTIIAITIQFCTGSYGPAISVIGSTVNLNGVLLLSNLASSSGGALFGNLATINIANSDFRSNEAIFSGGAMYLFGCTVTITASIFDSSVSVNGAAGYIEGGSFTMTNTQVFSSIGNNGGGFSFLNVQTTISGCQFSQNKAGGGNALEMVSSTLYCTNSIFTAGQGNNIDGLIHLLNQAPAYPGVNNYIINCTFTNSIGLRFSGVSIEDTNVGPNPVKPVTYIINSSFIGNTVYGEAGATGAALHGSNSIYHCKGCIFRGNSGAQLGGAAVCENQATCTFENSLFEENYSWGGAGVYIAASAIPTKASIINCSFVGNGLVASLAIAPAGFSFMGGAVFVGAESHLYLAGGSMVNNSAQYGGAIYIDTNFGNVEVSNILLQNNHATVHGGGIYFANFPAFTNVSAEPNITALTLVNNVAVNGGGGGIYVAQGIANYNPALYGAATLHNESQVCSYCKYSGNSAPYGNNFATDPFKLNVQISAQPINANTNVHLNIVETIHSLVNSNNTNNTSNTNSNSSASIDRFSISSASTMYVSAILVDFFNQRVSVISGAQVQVSAQNGIISNLLMTATSDSASNNSSTTSSGASSTNINILLIDGAVSFSLSLLSYPNSDASVSVSVPQLTGLASANLPLSVRGCSNDEFVEEVNESPALAVCAVIARMPTSGKAAALVVIALSYLVLALFFLFFIAYRNHRIVYQSSIVFCMLIMFGLACVNTAALLSALDKTVNTCTARIFLLHVGFAFSIGSVCIKLFRLQLIFNNPLLVMLKLSDRVMLWRLLVVFLLNVAPVIVWTVVDPFQASGLNDDACTSSNSLVYEITLLCFNTFVLFSSAYFAFCLRNTPSQYNETTALAALNYVMLVLGIVWILLRWVGNLSATSQSLAEAFLLTCAAFLTSCILFGPKVYVLTRALMHKAARISSQQLAGSSTGKTSSFVSCCCLLLNGAPSRSSGKTISERLNSDHSLNATGIRAATPRAGSQNPGLPSKANANANEMDFDEFEANVKNNPNELNTLLLDKISALKERLQARVGALKHNVRQVASAEKDVKEIILLLGSACSEYQFLHSRGNSVVGHGKAKDPFELVNDPLFTDAANAICKSYGFYTESGTGTGNGSARSDRKASTKAQGPSRRIESQVLAGMSPTNANNDCKYETPTATGRTLPLSGRSSSTTGRQGRSSGSTPGAITATVTSYAMPSKQSVPTTMTTPTTRHDSVMEHGTFGRAKAHATVPLIDLTAIIPADTHRNSARDSGSGSSSSRNGNATGNSNGVGNDSGRASDQIELEHLNTQR